MLERDYVYRLWFSSFLLFFSKMIYIAKLTLMQIKKNFQAGSDNCLLQTPIVHVVWSAHLAWLCACLNSSTWLIQWLVFFPQINFKLLKNTDCTLTLLPLEQSALGFAHSIRMSINTDWLAEWSSYYLLWTCLLSCTKYSTYQVIFKLVPIVLNIC